MSVLCEFPLQNENTFSLFPMSKPPVSNLCSISSLFPVPTSEPLSISSSIVSVKCNKRTRNDEEMKESKEYLEEERRNKYCRMENSIKRKDFSIGSNASISNGVNNSLSRKRAFQENEINNEINTLNCLLQQNTLTEKKRIKLSNESTNEFTNELTNELTKLSSKETAQATLFANIARLSQVEINFDIKCTLQQLEKQFPTVPVNNFELMNMVEQSVKQLTFVRTQKYLELFEQHFADRQKALDDQFQAHAMTSSSLSPDSCPYIS